jgi:hypothetical protein
MQVQSSNMMDPNPAAAFWGARHASWGGHAHAGVPTNGSAHNDPKMAEKLMTELQVRAGQRIFVERRTYWNPEGFTVLVKLYLLLLVSCKIVCSIEKPLHIACKTLRCNVGFGSGNMRVK